jgi:hypothetical protein
MIADKSAADRQLRGNEFDYRDKGLEHSATRNDGTADLIDNLTALAELGSFEEKSLEGDKLPEKSFTEGMTNFNDKFNSLSDSVARGTISITAAQNQLKIPAQDLLDNTDTITMNYEDFMMDGNNPSGEDAAANPVVRFAQMEFFQDLNQDILVDLENQMNEALAVDTDGGRIAATALRTELTTTKNLLNLTRGATSLMGQLVDKVQIDFGDMSKEQAKALYDSKLTSLTDLEAQHSEALTLNTDAGRIGATASNVELKLDRHVAKELERQFGFEKDDVLPERHEQSKFFVDLNESILKDLEAQMIQALAVDTDAGRMSSAALRTEITTTKSLIGFWRETAKFWKS